MVPKEAHALKLRTEGVDLPVSLQHHIGMGWLVADLLLTGFFGLIVDGITSRWNELEDVDVARALLGARATGTAVASREPGTQQLTERSSPAFAGQPRGDGLVLRTGKLAVLDFKSYAKDFKPEDVRYFSDLVRGATLRASPGLEVMTRENLIVLLQATGKDLSQCEGECEVDTGRRIGADAVVSGDVLKVGTRYKMSLRLHETHNGRLLSTAIASGKTVDELDESLQKAAEELMRPRR